MNRLIRILALLITLSTLTSVDAAAQSWKDKLKKAAAKVGAVVETAGVLLPIGTEKEIEIGRGIAATVAGRYPLSNDASLTEYVNLVGLTVAGEAPRNDIVYRFGVLETPDVNAFASPGGYIFITRGALDIIGSEAELAGVLAHEIGHVNERHVIEQIRKADVMREAKDQSGLTGEKLDKVVGHGSNVLFTGLSRGDEAAADSLGVEYAVSAGYDGSGLAAFVNKLAQRSKENRLAEVLSTHPPPGERLTRLNRIVERLAVGGEVLVERYREFVKR